MYATGLGSFPGTDFGAALRLTLGELGPHAYLPELPARGVGAQMIGRSLALLDGLSVDLQPSGWRLTSGSGADHRRAQALWRHDLDDLEEFAQGYDGSLTVTVCGLLTLAASVERPAGDRLLADHGARRELAESLASGYSAALAEIARRLPQLRVRAQVDEPMLPMVLAGSVPTASGFSKHRAVEVPEATRALERMVDAARPTTADVTVHCCAPGFPWEVARHAGVTAVALDRRTLTASDWDAVGGWLEAGHDFCLGVARTDQIDQVPAVDDLVRATLADLRALDLAPELLTERVVLTPACGLGLWTERPATEVLRRLVRAAELVPGELRR